MFSNVNKQNTYPIEIPDSADKIGHIRTLALNVNSI